MTTSNVVVCSFESGIKTSRMRYAEFREAVIAVGRFSVFEATATVKASKLYTRLCADPTVVTTPLGFPWTKVERKIP